MRYFPPQPQNNSSGGRNGATARSDGQSTTIAINKKPITPSGRWASQTVHPFQCRWHHWSGLTDDQKHGWSLHTPNISGTTQEFEIFDYSAMQCFMLINALRIRMGLGYTDDAPEPVHYEVDPGGYGQWLTEDSNALTLLWNTGFSQPFTHMLFWYAQPIPQLGFFSFFTVPKKKWRIFKIMPFTPTFVDDFQATLSTILPAPKPQQIWWWAGVCCDANACPGRYHFQNAVFSRGTQVIF